MRAAVILACCLLILPLCGTVKFSHARERSQAEQAARPSAERTRLLSDLQRTRQIIPTGQSDLARHLCETGHAESMRAKEYELAAKFLVNLGAVQFKARQFETALQTYRRAHSLATRAGDRNTAAVLTANIASLYSHLGELDAAAEWLEASAAALTGRDRQEHLPKVQLQLAAVRAREGRLDVALPLFASALEAADRAGDTALYSLIWNRIGEEYLKRDEPDNAEQPLLEAFRVRKLNRQPVDSSLFNLARLKLAQGDTDTAASLLNRAIELAQPLQTSLPMWDLYLTRGRLRLDQGRPAEARADLRIALGLARAWRWSSPADQASRVGSESLLQQVYSALIDAGNLLYRETGDPAVLNETADAAEENRAASLRDLISDPAQYRAQLPQAYWQVLGSLQRAEVSALARPTQESAAELRRLRAELVRLEAGLGPGSEAPETNVIGRTRAALDGDTAVLAFQLGRTRSWMWAIDRDGAAVYALPAASEIASAVAAVSDAMRSGSSAWKPPSERLHQILFGVLDPRFHRRGRWLVAPDTRLFEAPFAALVDGRDGLALAQRHSVQLIPNLAAIFQRSDRRAAPAGPFVGLGDAVYNSADPRRTGSLATLNLPRLVGSAQEIQACARVWDRSGSMLLTGADVSRPRLLAALAFRPSVVHIAAHVVESTRKPTYGLIALSPDSQGRTEVLTPFDIARWKIEAGVVVLSGCTSGGGAALPGAGLMGLTRAWLAAGAANVVATRWPVPDDAGAIFESFYRYLRAEDAADPAAALQRAQNEMIAAGGRRAHPRHWGAYFVVGAPVR